MIGGNWGTTLFGLVFTRRSGSSPLSAGSRGTKFSWKDARGAGEISTGSALSRAHSLSRHVHEHAQGKRKRDEPLDDSCQ